MTLKELREAKFLTQLQVAIKLGVNPTTVSNWERGIQDPRLAQIPILAELYGVTTQQIIDAVKAAKPA